MHFVFSPLLLGKDNTEIQNNDGSEFLMSSGDTIANEVFVDRDPTLSDATATADGLGECQLRISIATSVDDSSSVQPATISTHRIPSTSSSGTSADTSADGLQVLGRGVKQLIQAV